MEYNQALAQWTPEQWQQFGREGGTVNVENKLVGGGLTTPTVNTSPTTYGGLTAGDWMTGGGLALSAYNTFGGAQKELAEKQMEGIDANIKLANQQVKANKQAMADKKQFNNTWASASNGLAAQYANRIG